MVAPSFRRGKSRPAALKYYFRTSSFRMAQGIYHSGMALIELVLGRGRVQASLELLRVYGRILRDDTALEQQGLRVDR